MYELKRKATFYNAFDKFNITLSLPKGDSKSLYLLGPSIFKMFSFAEDFFAKGEQIKDLLRYFDLQA
jgi:hypothetical protein